MITTPHGKRENAGARLLAEFSPFPEHVSTLAADEIHRLRVSVKQTRAWLRFYHASSDKSEDHQALKQHLRGLSQRLAGPRDQYVAQLALAKIGRKYPGKKTQQLIEELQRVFVESQMPVPEAASVNPMIEQIRRGLASCTRLAPSAEAQHHEIRRAYPKLCHAGGVALATESCVDLHDWRKRVKTLGYQLAMLDPPLAHGRKFLNVLKKLGSGLGKIHDLCFLQDLIEAADAQQGLTLSPAPLLKRILRERHRLLVSVRKWHTRMCPPHAIEFSDS